MAIPLNTFKTTTAIIPEEPLGGFVGDSDVIYVVPSGITAIVLMAQVANIDSAEHTVSFSHYNRDPALNTELVKDFPVFPKDAAGLLTGKLIIEETNHVRCSASPGSGSNMKLVLSYLESLNG
jgi:hypothetical protein